MPYTPKQLAQSAPSASFSTAYTVPGATTTIVKQIMVTNVTAAVANANVNFIASGGSNTVANRVINNYPVAAGDVAFFDLTQVLAAGGFIQVQASVASALVYTISGVEIT